MPTLSADLAPILSLLPADSVHPAQATNLVDLVRWAAGDCGSSWLLPQAALFQALPARRATTVLWLVDGLGDNYLQGPGAASALAADRVGRLTSTFPATTAAAVTASMTGLPPISHGLVGWFIRDERCGGVLAPLPLLPRGEGELTMSLLTPRLFPYRTLYQRMGRRAWVVSPAFICESRFNRRHTRGAKRIAYESLDELVDGVDQAVMEAGPEGGFVYAYYHRFDSTSHQFGVGSSQTAEEFARVDAAYASLRQRLAGRNAELLVTADHGFVDVDPDHALQLADFPDVAACLDGPLWGERRIAYCSVRQGAEAAFEAAVTESLAGRGRALRADALLDSGLLGHGYRHRRIRERIGSHVLLMEPGWTIEDHVPGERPHPMIGVHGGLSPDEMWIPLVRPSLD